MVILKWLNSMLIGRRPEVDQAAAGEAFREAKKGEDAESVDLINAALIDHAESLNDLLIAGAPKLKRRRIKQKVRKKVEKVMAGEFSEPEIIDEITERITDAAEVDPYYENLFLKE